MSPVVVTINNSRLSN